MREEHERGIKFLFPDDWNVLKYENTELYKEKLMKIQNTKTVDFDCKKEDRVMLLEVKRFKEKPFCEKKTDLANFIQEVSWQFRDTLFGLAVAQASEDNSLADFGTAIGQNGVKLVLLLELESLPPSQTREMIRADVLAKLKQLFSLKNFAVRVVDTASLTRSTWKAGVE